MDIYDALAEPKYHALRSGVVQKRIDNLVVAELQQLRPSVDNRDLNAERGKHDGVLQANYATAHDAHRARDSAEAENFIRVEDRLAVERDVAGPRRTRAGSEQNVLRLEHLPLVAAFHFDVVL